MTSLSPLSTSPGSPCSAPNVPSPTARLLAVLWRLWRRLRLHPEPQGVEFVDIVTCARESKAFGAMFLIKYYVVCRDLLFRVVAARARK